ncbi:MAG: YlbF family regulator [Bacilli bacterium]|nr:YlbF family regulator [Bacilli bacterium]
MENVYKAIDAVIDCIISSKDYQMCISLQEQMKDNQEIMEAIQQVKKLQKKYIRSGYDTSIKQELDQCTQSLMEIPIYHLYQDSLEKVNEMICFVKESLNDYFSDKLNS